jgi:hypothetical protein
MTRTNSEVVGNVLQAAFQALNGTHHVLDVINIRKPNAQKIEESFLGGW